MKRIAIIISMIFCLLLGACSVTMVNAEQNRPVKIWAENSNGSYDVCIVVDETTGVNYIVVGGDMYQRPRGTAITPRLNEDGTLYVSK